MPQVFQRIVIDSAPRMATFDPTNRTQSYDISTIKMFGSEIFELALNSTRAHMNGSGNKPPDIPDGYIPNREQSYRSWAIREARRLGIPWERPRDDQIGLDRTTGRVAGVLEATVEDSFGRILGRVQSNNIRQGYVEVVASRNQAQSLIERFQVDPSNAGLPSSWVLESLGIPDANEEINNLAATIKGLLEQYVNASTQRASSIMDTLLSQIAAIQRAAGRYNNVRGLVQGSSTNQANPAVSAPLVSRSTTMVARGAATRRLNILAVNNYRNQRPGY